MFPFQFTMSKQLYASKRNGHRKLLVDSCYSEIERWSKNCSLKCLKASPFSSSLTFLAHTRTHTQRLYIEMTKDIDAKEEKRKIQLLRKSQRKWCLIQSDCSFCACVKTRTRSFFNEIVPVTIEKRLTRNWTYKLYAHWTLQWQPEK